LALDLEKVEWRVERAKRIYEQQGYPASPRQSMVVKFWNAPVSLSGQTVTGWLEEFYKQDPDRKRAWELWKRENPDADRSNDLERVPLGIGKEYLQRAKTIPP
jgi:hypothetical protein